MTNQSYEEIIYSLEGDVALITLNRPEKYNAWTGKMAAELKHALESAENNKGVVGIVITGAGKAFCSGADMAGLQALAGGQGAGVVAGETSLDANPGDPNMPEAYRKTFSYFASIQKPIIAAINGAVAGMSLGMVLFCDMRFFAKKGFVMSAFPQRGLVAEFYLA